jgi:molybdopterin converting factor small subunit
VTGATDAADVDRLITVRYYAAAAAATGLEQEHVRISGPESVESLTHRLADRHGAQLARVLESSSFLIDGIAGGTERVISTGATVDVLPPFAGG